MGGERGDLVSEVVDGVYESVEIEARYAEGGECARDGVVGA